MNNDVMKCATCISQMDSDALCGGRERRKTTSTAGDDDDDRTFVTGHQMAFLCPRCEKQKPHNDGHKNTQTQHTSWNPGKCHG